MVQLISRDRAIGVNFHAVLLYTRGFSDALALTDHHQRHCLLLKIVTVSEYEMRADYFLGGPRKIWVFEGKRKNGDVLRFNLFTNEFGILMKDGHILTYYICERKKHGKCTNLCYFLAECARYK